MLAKEVPNNTSENQIPSLRSQLSNHVQSVASPQYKHQLKMRLAKKFPDKRLSLNVYSTKVKHNLLPEETH